MDDREDEGKTMPAQSSAAAGGQEAGASSAIGRRLKAYYDDVASEPVPDRFMALLDALDAADSKRTGRG
ncbi:NepR family anti-sigma factor [Aureimonas populi]|uniref:NepR family anti-sigma factor n=1 Tax=Aureimonas populi TaxID=1701758 RepID=A0ABW5CHY5_9HYPH|nr:NepR family anti-sigma factor [Aureimonas populi]